MNWLWLCVTLVACKGHEAPKRVPDPIVLDAAPSPVKAPMSWARIEELVAVTPAGPSTELERAVTIAQTNHDAWHELKSKSSPLAKYPHGAEAMVALEAWAAAHGGFPTVPVPELGATLLAESDLGDLAVVAGDASMTTAMYLASAMLERGRNFIEPRMAISLIERARKVTHAPLAPAHHPDLVRILASDALTSRAALDYVSTADGRKDFTTRAKGIGSDAAHAVKAVTGKDLVSMIPSDDQAVATKQFWLVALDGATRGEPAATTIERMRKAVGSAPEAAKPSAEAALSLVEQLNDSFATLYSP